MKMEFFLERDTPVEGVCWFWGRISKSKHWTNAYYFGCFDGLTWSA